MCLGCNCPDPIPPPSQKLATCRKYLQGLAIALVAIGVVGLVCSQIMQFIFNLLLIYILYMGWTTFNWCMVLTFFIFSTMQTVQSLILFVGILQYNQFLTKGYIVVSIYCLLLIIYYPVAVFLSHYCYKHFKNSFSENNQLFMRRPGGNDGGGQIGGGFGGRYQRIVDDRIDDQAQNQPRVQPQNNSNSNQYFRGEGVRIG